MAKISLVLGLGCVVASLAFCAASGLGWLDDEVSLAPAGELWPEPPIAGGGPRSPQPREPSLVLSTEPRRSSEQSGPENHGEGEADGDPLPGEGECAIRGRVGVSRGQLPEEVRVFVTRVGGNADDEELDGSSSEVEVDRNGEFLVIGEPGKYRLHARAAGFVPAGVSALVLAEQEDVRDVLIELEPGLSIRGTVRAEGEPAAWVRVLVQGHGFRVSRETDDEGRFELDGLPAGEYRVMAYSDFLGADERVVRAGAEVGLELDLRERLQGRVLDASGQPAPSVAVFGVHRHEAEDPLDEDPFGTIDTDEVTGHGLCRPTPLCTRLAVTDEAGRFAIPVARGTRLTLAAGSGDLRTEVMESAWNGPEVVLQLQRVPTVRLRVTSADGIAQPGRRVFVEPLAEDRDFAGEVLTAGREGLVAVRTWPGTYLVIRGEADTRLMPTDPLPPNLRLGEPPRSRPVRAVAREPVRAAAATTSLEH